MLQLVYLILLNGIVIIMNNKINMNLKLAVIGLGYVGLPLAVEFGKKRDVVGFDINEKRVDQLNSGFDSTNETSVSELKEAKRLIITSSPKKIKDCNCYIVTVPTPIDDHNEPDLSPLISSTETIARVLKVGDIVIYESTVYPGCTEDVCVPILQEISGLKFNEDFYCGYSPERINPGDKIHRITTVKKVTSGSNSAIAEIVDDLYKEIVAAGTHKAPSIKVAEAAKVIENTQRDLNIALVNELAIIFNKLEIDTESVLEAAGSKWNFIPFRPGLVGGHCIGVDPYYLTYKAKSIGYHPEIILAGRKLNDSMGQYVASKLIKAMANNMIPIGGSKILVMGLTFKENCPDLRNSRVVDVINELRGFNCNVQVYDPWVDPQEAFREYGINVIDEFDNCLYDAIVITVAHDQFKEMGGKAIRELGNKHCIIYDIKNTLSHDESDMRL